MSDARSLLLRSTVYGSAEPDLDDLAESYHEASKLYPALGQRQSAGMGRLVRNPQLLAATRRTPRTNPLLPTTDLGGPQPPVASLWSAIHARRSISPAPSSSLSLPTVATLLTGAYGAIDDGHRSVPSGGALYPLELYLVAQRIEGLAPGVFHADPVRGVLEIVEAGDIGYRLPETCPVPELLVDAAAVVFVTSVFWRTRFKYGLRGYRFALLEAGHVAQNIVLLAAALGVRALPLGGFYDARVETLLGVDGVDESVVYGLVLGGALT